MHIVIFGLSISSSWGNGHATLWRGLLKALSQRGHTVSFYEKNVPYYESTRDEWSHPSGLRLILYDSLAAVRADAELELDVADVAICTSYCPDGVAASRMILDSRAYLKIFYDLDTPITLSKLRAAEGVPYLLPEGLSEFDFVLSYTGGRALEELQSRLGARRVAPLYGSVDMDTHHPVAPIPEFRGALSYLGTYAADRQKALEELFLAPAGRMPQERFILGGAQYPATFPWEKNIFFLRHLPATLHPALFCSTRATLNVTRGSMAEYGYCPSGRLFEAAACGAPILSDWWEGLDTFFAPGKEILRVQSADDVCDALRLSEMELRAVGISARNRVLEEHTSAHRVLELESICEKAQTNPQEFTITI